MLRCWRNLLSIAVIVGSAASVANAEDALPRGKLPEGVAPMHYALDLEIFPGEESFSGRASIRVELGKATKTIWMHGRGLDASEAYVLRRDGARVAASFEEIEDTGIGQIQTESPVGPGSVDIVIRYTAAFNNHLEGLFRVVKGDKAYAYTQFQPLRARMAFPGFDEPRFKTPFDIAITVRAGHDAVSNAPVKDTVNIGDGKKRVVFATTAPLPTYLVALAVGEFDVVEWDPIPPNDIRQHPIPLRGVAVKGKGGDLTYALQQTAEMLEVLERYFGRSYPFAKLDLVVPAELRAAGMENAGAVFYRSDKILMSDTPSIWQLRSFASLHLHELAHSWFGNLVTPAWWDDLWLNEAFSTWITDRALFAWKPDEYGRHRSVRGARRAMWYDRLASARQIRQPIENEGDISHAFDSITYQKGGGLLSMIEQYLGEDVFRAGVRRFIGNHEYDVATADDFIAALSQSANDPGIIEAFRSFLEQSGTPLIEANWSCEPNGATDLHLKQSRSLPLGSTADAKRLWSIPLCIAYQDGDGRGEACTLMREASTTVRLPTNSCPAWVMPNAGGAAYVNFTLPADSWEALIEKLPALPPGEAIAIMGSLRAAYQAGRVGTDLLLEAAKILARSERWDVANAPMQVLRNLKNYYSPRDLRPMAIERLRDLYRPALAQFDLSDRALSGEAATIDQALLRADVIWFMALDADDPDLRRRLTRLAKTYLGYGFDRPPDPTALHPDLVRIALMTAAGEEDLPFIEFLIETLRETDDPLIREHVIRALGYQTDQATLERVWKHILDPKTPEWIASSLLRRQSGRVDNREAIFEWITAHYDLLPERLSERRMRWLPWRSAYFCTKRDRDRVEAFYAERSKEHQGGERVLRNVLEQIEICAAVAQAQAADTAAVLGREP